MSFKEKADGSQMVKQSMAALFKVRNHCGPYEDQKTDTHTHTHTPKIIWTGQTEESQSLSPHLLPANATGLQAGLTCQTHASTVTHKHSHTQIFTHTHIPSVVCHKV